MILTLVGNVVQVTEVTGASRLLSLFNNSTLQLASFSANTTVTLPKLATGIYTIIGIDENMIVSNSVEYTSLETFTLQGAITSGIVKWVYASIVKTIKSSLDDLKLYIDVDVGEVNLDKWAELRIDGPYLKQLGPNNWQGLWDVNCMVSAAPSTVDAFAFRTLMGQVLGTFPVAIPVFKYGSLAADTGEYVGCLMRTSKSPLQCGYLGRKTNANIEQGCIEDHYGLEWEEA